MSNAEGHYLRALRFRFLTRFYDRVVGTFLKEDCLKRRLIDQAGVGAGSAVLDLACGTGTLTLELQHGTPDALVVGLDGDLDMLAIARAKFRAAGAPVRLCAALAQEPPFAEAGFDRVVSSLFFHHLRPAAKREVLRTVRRLLAPGGEIHVLDWGKAQDVAMRLMFVWVQLLDGFATTGDHVRGRFPALLREAGFRRVTEPHRERTIAGTLSLYRGNGEGTAIRRANGPDGYTVASRSTHTDGENE